MGGFSERLQLFLKVSEVVAYAHRELVIHRDLKPGNILVTADGLPKLLDFGIGKLIEEGAMREGLTQAFPGIQMLMPEYASPEPVRNEAAGTGTDIYAILYELLSGVKAHVFPDTSPASVWEVVCELLATKPSTAAARHYLTASELADDIKNYLNGYPVHARPDRWSYRLQKFLKRNRMAVVAGVMAVVALATAMVPQGERPDSGPTPRGGVATKSYSGEPG